MRKHTKTLEEELEGKGAPYVSKGKCKAIPLQAWTGPAGSKSFRLPDFKTIST